MASPLRWDWELRGRSSSPTPAMALMAPQEAAQLWFLRTSCPLPSFSTAVHVLSLVLRMSYLQGQWVCTDLTVFFVNTRMS